MADTQSPAGLSFLRAFGARRTGSDLGLELHQSVVRAEKPEPCEQSFCGNLCLIHSLKITFTISGR